MNCTDCIHKEICCKWRNDGSDTMQTVMNTFAPLLWEKAEESVGYMFASVCKHYKFKEPSADGT